MAMPIGLRRLSALHPDGVPWAWGINGITSVLASALGVFIAIVAGFTVATLAALACYLVAIAHVVRGRWPDDAPRRRGASRGRAARRRPPRGDPCSRRHPELERARVAARLPRLAGARRRAPPTR